MYACVCVCMYVCMMYVCTFACMHVCIYVRMYVCMCIYVYVCMYRVHVCMYHMYVYVYVCVSVVAHTHTHIHHTYVTYMNKNINYAYSCIHVQAQACMHIVCIPQVHSYTRTNEYMHIYTCTPAQTYMHADQPTLHGEDQFLEVSFCSHEDARLLTHDCIKTHIVTHAHGRPTTWCQPWCVRQLSAHLRVTKSPTWRGSAS